MSGHEPLGGRHVPGLTNAADFKREIEEARPVGYAIDRSEFYDGVGGVAAPLTSDKGYEGLASFLGPIERVEELGLERLGRRLGNLTARASLSLGDRERMRFFGSE